MTLTCSPEGWIAKGAGQMRSAKCIWKAPQTAAEQCRQVVLAGSPQVRLRLTKTQPSYDCRGGRHKCGIQHQPDTGTPGWLPIRIIGNLRTTTTTEIEIQCTAQAQRANFVIMVSSMTPNTVQSRRPASQASAGINPLFLGDFSKCSVHFFVFVNPGILSFFS